MTVDRVLDFLVTQDMLVVVLGTFVFLAIETSLFVGLLVPGDVVALIAGAAADSPLEYAILVITAIAGALLGESLGYAIGRRYGRRLPHTRLGRVLGEDRWRRAESLARGQDGGWALVAGRFVPVLHSMVPVLAGTLGVSYRRFIAWEAVGALLWSAIYVGIGTLASVGLREHGHRLGYVGPAVALLVVTLAIVSRQVRARVNAAAETPSPPPSRSRSTFGSTSQSTSRSPQSAPVSVPVLSGSDGHHVIGADASDTR